MNHNQTASIRFYCVLKYEYKTKIYVRIYIVSSPTASQSMAQNQF